MNGILFSRAIAPSQVTSDSRGQQLFHEAFQKNNSKTFVEKKQEAFADMLLICTFVGVCAGEGALFVCKDIPDKPGPDSLFPLLFGTTQMLY